MTRHQTQYKVYLKLFQLSVIRQLLLFCGCSLFSILSFFLYDKMFFDYDLHNLNGMHLRTFIKALLENAKSGILMVDQSTVHTT